MEPRQLNDSVYEFSERSEDFNLEVVAFHGLRFSDYGDAYKTTWHNEDGKQCWLRDFIPTIFPKARILSVSYDSCAEAGRMSFSNIGRILVQDLIHLAEVGQRGCPVLLIGYCLGGLVIQQLCTEAEKQFGLVVDGSSKGRLDHFLTNVRVILSLDTPYAGSSLGEYLRKRRQCRGPVLEYLSESSTFLGNLNSEFDSLAFEREWDRFCFWYTGSTQVWNSLELPTSADQVVREESARRCQGKGEFFLVEAPHSGQAVSQPRAWRKLGELLEQKLAGVLKEFMDRTKLKGSVHHQETEETAKSTNPPDEREQEVKKQEYKKGEQINDSLYEMYRPDLGKNVKLELIFFPGSLDEDAYESTWMTEDNQRCWLQTWLPEAFPEARIWAVSYGSYQEGQEFDLYTTCENLMQNIIFCGRGRDSQESLAEESRQKRFREEIPLILVGHCFGGLVIKELCNQVAERLKREWDEGKQFTLQGFLNSVRGVAYYGTSHSGYSSDDKRLKIFSGSVNRGSSSKDLARRAAGRLRSGYVRCITEYGWKELGLGETRPTQGSTDIIVDEFAASDGVQRTSFFPVAADHISICKPKSPFSNSFLYLEHFIHTTLNEAQYRNMNLRRKKPRGIAIIIGMEKERPGCEVDRHRLAAMAEYLGFLPLHLVNKTAEKLPSLIKTILMDDVEEEDECVLCCVNSHGAVLNGEQLIYDNEGSPIYFLSDILKPIGDCPLLAGKPKVFVVNACRVLIGEEGTQQEQNDVQGTDDCLLMYATQLGKEAWRRETGDQKGTLFISEVTDHVNMLYQTTDVQDIFTKVAEKVPELAARSNVEQFPMLYSSLRKRLSWRPR